jgi:putative lipoprotein
MSPRRCAARPLPPFIAALLASLTALLLSAPSARADPTPSPDPWFARDKALHFAASAAIAAGGYGTSAFVTDEVAGRVAFGAGLAIGAGIAKEALDAAGFGTPSLRDFTWDVIGTAVGVGVCITLDLALRDPPRPVQVR